MKRPWQWQLAWCQADEDSHCCYCWQSCWPEDEQWRSAEQNFCVALNLLTTLAPQLSPSFSVRGTCSSFVEFSHLLTSLEAASFVHKWRHSFSKTSVGREQQLANCMKDFFCMQKWGMSHTSLNACTVKLITAFVDGVSFRSRHPTLIASTVLDGCVWIIGALRLDK